ncbi:CPBP family intramembrane glutamic endopeptidase [Candidatus Enterococcus murrayae]|uniref:CPBP family intramembrane metalloprotease n=1 Tax=Candidatus Enterococcus murrayae TaxID=2815321 RepID=A0ABS3HGU3_9ENTE|nr:type II CAAX endopeptidase family protein [Enterococcus sp. MJM16]MBO0452644.1 CPBP family intramembrane metalloprotease [Enterococcus sp. MJM16]
MRNTKKAVITFLILCFALSTIFYVLIINYQIMNMSYLLMWCPGIAAIIVKRLYHRDEKMFNLKKGKLKYVLSGIEIPLLYSLSSYGIYLIMRGNGVITGNTLRTLLSQPLILLLYIAIFFITALGEEIGWRGFLNREMFELFGYRKGAFLTGCIWAIWHLPLIVTGYVSSIPVWYQVPIYVIQCIAMSYPMSYLSLKSKSVWPAAVFHFAHNFVIQILLDQSIGGQNKPYLVGETGILTIAIILIVCYFYAKKPLDSLEESRAFENR